MTFDPNWEIHPTYQILRTPISTYLVKLDKESRQWLVVKIGKDEITELSSFRKIAEAKQLVQNLVKKEEPKWD